MKIIAFRFIAEHSQHTAVAGTKHCEMEPDSVDLPSGFTI